MAALTSNLPDFATLDRGALRRLREQIAAELNTAEMDRTRQNADAIRGRCRTLAGFVREAWHVLEPRNPLKWSWHLQAMCLPGHSVVTTEQGPMRIDAIVDSGWRGRVLSLNHETNALEWRPVVRRVRSPGAALLAITTHTGQTIKATENHPIYVVGRGYVRADQIVAGDRVLSVRAMPTTSLETDRKILQPQVLRRVEGKARNAALPGLWIAENTECETLPRLQGGGEPARLRHTVCGVREAGLHHAGSHETNLSEDGRILRPHLSRKIYHRGEEPGVRQRREADHLQSVSIQNRQAPSVGTRRTDLLPLFGICTLGSPSRRSRPIKQPNEQFGNALPAMPYGSAPAAVGEGRGAFEDIVITIAREVQLPDAVYNLEVQGNHNYVADGFVTHNCDHLEAITRGELTPWLIINVPPGSSKSMIVSVLWQAWVWGPFGNPASRWVSSSFDLANVTRDTRKCRDLIMSEWYRELWPEVFDGDGRLKRSGETSFENHDFGFRQGVAFASITGKRGDVVIIDDPHSVDGAESETERNATVRKFVEGGLNRSNDAMTSAMVIVMQRIHEQDLTGALLARDLGFVHLVIPMEFEPERRCSTPLVVKATDGIKKNWTDPRSYDGELMDPVRMPPPAIERQKKAGDYVWAGQYQQRPAPREGGLFKIPEDWQTSMVVNAVPAGAAPFRGWDLAGSTRKTSAYTVGVKMSRHLGLIYVEDVVRARATPNEVELLVVKTSADDGFGAFQDLPQDPGQAGKAQKMRYAELLAGRLFSITPETGSKSDRALPFASQVEAGMVRLVRGTWNAAFIEELRTFPAGTYKDQVDAASRAFAAVLRAGGAQDQFGGVLTFEPGDLSLA